MEKLEKITEAKDNNTPELKYRNSISKQLIGENIEGKKIIDLGSGSAPNLYNLIKEKNADYIYYDINTLFVKEQKNKSDADIIQGQVENLPFKDNSIEIAHTRYLLLHLAPDQRKKAIEEAVRIAKEKAIFIDYDWKAFKKEGLTNRFFNLAITIMKLKDLEVFPDGELREEIEMALKNKKILIQEKRFPSETKAYYENELIPFVKQMQKIAFDLKKEEELQTANKLMDDIKNEATKENPVKFPDIIAIEVIK